MRAKYKFEKEKLQRGDKKREKKEACFTSSTSREAHTQPVPMNYTREREGARIAFLRGNCIPSLSLSNRNNTWNSPIREKIIITDRNFNVPTRVGIRFCKQKKTESKRCHLTFRHFLG